MNHTDPLGTSAHGEAGLGESEAEIRAKNESVGELFSRLANNLSTLMRQEFALAKAEATDSAKRAGTGIGMMVGGAVAAIMLLIFLSTALMWALGSAMHLGWAAFIVAILWAIICGALVMLGKKKFNEVKGLPQTQATMQDIPPTVNPKEQTP